MPIVGAPACWRHTQADERLDNKKFLMVSGLRLPKPYIYRFLAQSSGVCMQEALSVRSPVSFPLLLSNTWTKAFLCRELAKFPHAAGLKLLPVPRQDAAFYWRYAPVRTALADRGEAKCVAQAATGAACTHLAMVFCRVGAGQFDAGAFTYTGKFGFAVC